MNLPRKCARRGFFSLLLYLISEIQKLALQFKPSFSNNLTGFLKIGLCRTRQTIKWSFRFLLYYQCSQRRGLHLSFRQFCSSYSICQGTQFSLFLCPRGSNMHYSSIRKLSNHQLLLLVHKLLVCDTQEVRLDNLRVIFGFKL